MCRYLKDLRNETISRKIFYESSQNKVQQNFEEFPEVYPFFTKRLFSTALNCN
jgi:hypothetical protein